MWNFVIGNQPPLGAILVRQVGDQHWLQFVSLKLLAIVAGDLADRPAVEGNGCTIGRMIGLRPRMDGNAIRALGETSDGRGATIACDGIPGVAKLLPDKAGSELLSGSKFLRSGVDLRRVLKQRLLQPFIHDVLVLDVIEAENTCADQETRGDRRPGNHQYLTTGIRLALRARGESNFHCQKETSPPQS